MRLAVASAYALTVGFILGYAVAHLMILAV